MKCLFLQTSSRRQQSPGCRSVLQWDVTWGQHTHYTLIKHLYDSHWVCGNTTSICCSVDIFNSLIIFQGCCALADYLHLGLQFILFWFGLLVVTIHNKDSVLSFVSVCRVQVCRTGQRRNIQQPNSRRFDETCGDQGHTRHSSGIHKDENISWKQKLLLSVNQSVWIPLNCSVFALKARHLYPNISTSLFTSKVRMFWFFLG